jgi:hypothetical protein
MRSVIRRFSFLLLAVLLLAARKEPRLPFGVWRRASDTPILAPRGPGWEAAGTFNPAVALRGDKIVMFYRAQDEHGTSRLGYAESEDGIHFTRRDEPVLSPSEAYEKDGGVEDPRLVQFGDIYYLTYTGYNKTDAQLCLATSKDLVHWDRKGLTIPANKGNWNVKWTKIWGDCSREDRWQVLDVFPGHERRRQGSGGARILDGLAPLDRGYTGARVDCESREV